jgi:hypothetical protein
MKLQMFIVLGVTCLIPSIVTSEPTFGTLIGKGGGIIDYECQSINANRIACDFVQVLLHKEEVPKISDAEIEKFLSDPEDVPCQMADAAKAFINVPKVGSDVTILGIKQVTPSTMNIWSFM